MQFRVRAITNDDKIIELQIEAINEDQTRKLVIDRGMYAVSIVPYEKSIQKTDASSGHFHQKFSLLLFSQELHALLGAGLSIVESLEALLEKELNPFSLEILRHLLHGLQEGKRFSQVLEEQTAIFPPLYVGIIQASERTSSLGESLARYIAYQNRIELIRNKVISALIYPSILITVGAAVTFFLIAYVVPRFAEVYRGTGRQLPWMSKLLLDWGSFVSAHGVVLGLTGVVLLLVFVVVSVRYFQSGGFVALLARLPGIGTYSRIYGLSRIYLTLGMLLDGGIPIVHALTTVSGTVHKQLRVSLQAASASIQTGIVLSDAFLENGLTTPISYRMLRVGERSGELGRMLTQSANFYEGEISRWIDRFIRSFEPILMAVIGIVVGVIVMLLYMPIFDLADGLN